MVVIYLSLSGWWGPKHKVSHYHIRLKSTLIIRWIVKHSAFSLYAEIELFFSFSEKTETSYFQHKKSIIHVLLFMCSSRHTAHVVKTFLKVCHNELVQILMVSGNSVHSEQCRSNRKHPLYLHKITSEKCSKELYIPLQSSQSAPAGWNQWLCRWKTTWRRGSAMNHWTPRTATPDSAPLWHLHSRVEQWSWWALL